MPGGGPATQRAVRIAAVAVGGPDDVERMIAGEVTETVKVIAEDDDTVFDHDMDSGSILRDDSEFLREFLDAGFAPAVARHAGRIVEAVHAWVATHGAMSMDGDGARALFEVYVDARQQAGCWDDPGEAGAEVARFVRLFRDLGGAYVSSVGPLFAGLPAAHRETLAGVLEQWQRDLDRRRNDSNGGATRSEYEACYRLREFLALDSGEPDRMIEVLLSWTPGVWGTALMYAEASGDHGRVRRMMVRAVAAGAITCGESTEMAVNVSEFCDRLFGADASSTVDAVEVAETVSAIAELLPDMDELEPLDNLALAQCELMIRLHLHGGDRAGAVAVLEYLDLTWQSPRRSDLTGLTGGRRRSSSSSLPNSLMTWDGGPISPGRGRSRGTPGRPCRTSAGQCRRWCADPHASVRTATVQVRPRSTGSTAGSSVRTA